MFPLSHLQHLTKHTWNLFMPVSSSPLPWFLVTNMLPELPFCWTLPTLSRHQGAKTLFGPFSVHTHMYTLTHIHMHTLTHTQTRAHQSQEISLHACKHIQWKAFRLSDPVPFFLLFFLAICSFISENKHTWQYWRATKSISLFTEQHNWVA